MKRWLLSLSFAALFATLASTAFALPTVNDVQAQVQKGNYTEAQTMMREVVEARPGSAKAHYIYAEILAHNARFTDAAEQVRIAKQLDPAVKFADPEKFRSFEALIDREQQRGAATPAPATRTADAPRASMPAVAPVTRAAEAPAERSSGIPVWVWVAVAVVAFGAWRLMRTRPGPAMAGGMVPGAYAGPGPQQPSYGPGPGYGNGGGGFGGGLMQQPGRGGSGLLGTGLAAAGGVAAGMMAERWLEGNREHGANPGNAAVDGGGAGLAGGNSFAAPGNDAAAQELESRDVDFGTGGNDWDAGNSDAGSFDTGGGGGGDDW